MELQELQKRVAAVPYWYHKIELPGGLVTPGWAPLCAEKYAIPADLTGKRVLDIGAWDGYWTWEALKRGAREVVAIDDFSDTCGAPDKINRGRKWETFDLCREAFGFTDGPDSDSCGRWFNENQQAVQRMEISVYDVSVEVLGRFDVVFFFGTIYHLKHPLLALEKIAAVCDGDLYLESAICDDFSPYRGGLDRGYRGGDMVAEFYPTNEYGANPSNWWVPTLQCLGYQVQSAGFRMVELWRLTENPKGPAQCRGFVYASKREGEVPPNVAQWRRTEKILHRPKVAAVMSVPRLGFNANRESVFQVLSALRINLRHMYGAFWHQHLECGLQMEIDQGAELLLTIDYDTLFKREDLQELLALMEEHPEVDALVPIELKRGGGGPLCSMKTRTGQPMVGVPRALLQGELAPIATGHFGLTLIRASTLLKMPHPWFLPEPDKDGQWGRDRTDADIYFWRHLAASGGRAFLAPRVVIGHIEEMATFPDQNMQPIYQVPGDFHENGKPANCWK